MAALSAAVRIFLGLGAVGFSAVLQTLVLVVLLPSRYARIRSCIMFERLVGHSCAWLAGCRLKISGKEHLDGARPAIYILNHTSLVDLFIALQLMPGSAVGIVKKEIVRYPFFGQMYLLTGHLRVDRSSREAAVASMQGLGRLVAKHKLSIIMAPEGTRAKDGRLQVMKKGVIHLALQTGLPIVPIVVCGANKVMQRGTLEVKISDVQVKVLPPFDTTHWTAAKTDDAAEELSVIYRRELPADQLPLPA